MTSEDFREILERYGVFYHRDRVLNLWTIFIDDQALYLSEENLEELTEDELGMFLTKQLVTNLLANKEQNKNIVVH
jgi:hypothetical protein